MGCPRCAAPLAVQEVGSVCPAGHGQHIPFRAVKKRYPDAGRLLTQALERTTPGPPCAACARRMVTVHVRRRELDVCRPCQALWLDAKEEKAFQTSFAGAAVPDGALLVAEILGALVP